MDRFDQLNLYAQQTDEYFLPEDKYRPLPWRVAASYVGLVKSPFTASIGIGKAYATLAGTSILYHYVYRPKIWRTAVKTGELKWVGFPGFRGFAQGPRGGVMRKMGHWLFGQMLRPVLKTQAYDLYRKRGLMGVAMYMKQAGKPGLARKIYKVARVLGGGSIKVGRVAASLGRTAAWGMLAYDVVRGGIALAGAAMNRGLRILDRVHTTLVRLRRNQLPEAYRMPQAATLRSLALQEIHTSRTNVRSVLLGNEAAYMHRAL